MRGLVVLVLLAAVEAISSEQACPLEPVNCSCSWGPSNAYELICPKDVQLQVQESLIIGSFFPNDYIQLQCTNMNDWEKLSLVSGLKIGKVKSVSLRFCPLPGISFKEILASMGIPSTQKLQVQSHGNMSNTLTQRHLEGLSELTTLHLNMNGLTELPEDLFQDLGNLTWLDLRNNNVLLPKGIFRPVPKLDVLEIGGNNISYLEPGIFRNLTKLRLLNLWGNRLQNLTRSTFSDVPNLENLDLNNNGLQTLPPDVFTNLVKLKKINLFGNNFNWLPQSLFSSTPELEIIQIYSNRRSLETLPPALFQNLRYLKELNLNSCNISYLPEDLLVNCSSLEQLILNKNLLTSLPSGIFQDLNDLQELNLSENKLSNLPDSVFSKLYKLKVLNLSKNELSSISKELFANLREVEKLDLSHNRIKEIHPHGFQVNGNLFKLDLSHNVLTSLKKTHMSLFGDDSILNSLVKLQDLFLSHNHLDSIYADWRISMTNLRVLDLSYNNFTNITLLDLQFTSSLLTADLSYNKIYLIDFYEAEELIRGRYEGVKSGIQENNSAKVILKGNSLVCDCNAYHLIRYFRDELPELRLMVDLNGEGLTCAEEPKILSGIKVDTIDPRLLVCQEEEKLCPVNCSCFFRPRDKAFIVDCAERGLTEMPKNISYDKRVTAITNHSEIDLSYNQITEIPIRLEGYSRVTNLNLSFNNITSVNLTSFGKNLQNLQLNNNNLTRIDQDTLRILKELKSLESLTLQKNPWICDCQAKDFHAFLQANFKKIPNINNITCSNGVSLALMTAGELCPLTSIAIAITSAMLAILGFVLGGSVAFYYRYQREIKIWLYSHRLCLWFVTEEELDKDKQYDAFVSYSHQDEKFITEHLQPMLENGNPKYKLCLHYRDWVVGEFIPNQIARSVEESRRTIVVLSPNFLESVWGRMEFRTAHSQALSEGRARVIVILYGDIGPTDGLDSELKAYLSTNTYVKWGDPWFWEKLRYALPHPPELTKGIPLLPRQPIMRNGSEKLINGTNTNSTNATTPADTLIIEPLKTLSNSKPI